jgi:hypothetical protein
VTAQSAIIKSWESKRWERSDASNRFSSSYLGHQCSATNLDATYTDTINLMEEFTKDFTKSEQELFWAGTAKRVYKLEV